QRELRHEPDPDRARRRQVRAERAGEQHLLDLPLVDSELLDEELPPGRDRRLRELQLADVALREVDRVADVALVALPVQDEDALAILAADEPLGERRLE